MNEPERNEKPPLINRILRWAFYGHLVPIGALVASGNWKLAFPITCFSFAFLVTDRIIRDVNRGA